MPLPDPTSEEYAELEACACRRAPKGSTYVR